MAILEIDQKWSLSRYLVLGIACSKRLDSGKTINVCVFNEGVLHYARKKHFFKKHFVKM